MKWLEEVRLWSPDQPGWLFLSFAHLAGASLLLNLSFLVTVEVMSYPATFKA